MLQTIKEAKALAKGLRREVLNHTADELASLMHTQWLDVLAKAAGMPSWNVLETRLEAAAKAEAVQEDANAQTPAKAPARTAGSTYLSNEDGKFDFDVQGDEDCGLLDGLTLKPIEGALALTPGLALLRGGQRKDGKFLRVEGDETKMDWNGQRPQTSSRGQALFVTEGGCATEQSLLVLLPVRTEEEWPVREALVSEYRNWLLHNARGPAHVATWLEQALQEIGFKLTDAEETRVLESFEKSSLEG